MTILDFRYPLLRSSLSITGFSSASGALVFRSMAIFVAGHVSGILTSSIVIEHYISSLLALARVDASSFFLAFLFEFVSMFDPGLNDVYLCVP